MAKSGEENKNSVAPFAFACLADPCYRAVLYVMCFVLAHTIALYYAGFDVEVVAKRSALIKALHIADVEWMKRVYVTQAVVAFFSLCAYASLFVASGEPLGYLLRESTDLSGQTAVVTGGSSGIGRETALQLLLWKCKVVITGRDKTRGANAIEYLRKNARVGFDMIQYVEMDLNDPKSIKRAADEILRTNSSIDFLINNAGVAGSPTINAHKKESMFATNFLGHFHLTKLLTSALVRDRARIINVSSIAHYHYDPSGDPLFSGGKSTQLPPQTSAKVYYGRSKLFNMWHAQALQRRFDKLPDEAKGVACFSCGPGIVSTPLLERYSSLVLPSVVYAVIRCFTKRPKDGANTLLYLCSAPMQQLTPGAYYYECRLGYVSKHAQDVAKQEALYAVADKMTGS